MLLIYILIIIFIFLLTYTFFSQQETNKIIEGLENTQSVKKEYQPYNLNDPNNALILAQQNAGNIEVLKDRIDIVNGVTNKIDIMQRNIDTLQVQVDGLIQQQAEYGQQLAGSTPLTITGTNEEIDEEY
jgi:hypothetical protein